MSADFEQIRRSALEDFMGAINAALETYRPEGALLVLTLGNKHLGGESAVDLIARGETARVMEYLHAMTGMIAT